MRKLILFQLIYAFTFKFVHELRKVRKIPLVTECDGFDSREMRIKQQLLLTYSLKQKSFFKFGRNDLRFFDKLEELVYSTTYKNSKSHYLELFFI